MPAGFLGGARLSHLFECAFGSFLTPPTNSNAFYCRRQCFSDSPRVGKPLALALLAVTIYNPTQQHITLHHDSLHKDSAIYTVPFGRNECLCRAIKNGEICCRRSNIQNTANSSESSDATTTVFNQL